MADVMRKYLPALIQRMKMEDAAEYMKKERLITDNEYDKIMNVIISKQEKAEYFLYEIYPTKGPTRLELLRRCLLKSSQKDLAMLLGATEEEAELYRPEEMYSGNRERMDVTHLVGGPVFLLYARQHEVDECRDIFQLTKHLSSLGVNCEVDIKEDMVHLSDCSQWVINKIKLCCKRGGHVLMVCSEGLSRSLSSGKSLEINMRYGKFNSLAINNLLAEQGILDRCIPVFVNRQSNSALIPQYLKGKMSFNLSIQTFEHHLTSNSLEKTIKMPLFSNLCDLCTLLLGVAPYGNDELHKTVLTDLELSNERLRFVAETVKDQWPSLATKLTISQTKVEDIQSSYPSNSVEQCYRMLLGWMEVMTEKQEVNIKGLLQEALAEYHWRDTLN